MQSRKKYSLYNFFVMNEEASKAFDFIGFLRSILALRGEESYRISFYLFFIT